MLSKDAIDNFKALLEVSASARNEVRDFNRKGKWREAEPDAERKGLFTLKEEIKKTQNGAESQIGDTLDWLDVSFFTEGDIVKRAVAYVTVISDRFTKTGSGFMISNTLFMTNNHVILNEEEAKLTTVTFNKENDTNGRPLATSAFRLDPDKFFLRSQQEELDYSIIAIGPKVFGELDIEECGYFVLSDAPDKHVIGMNVNIIQHPLDLPKKVTFRKNLLTFRSDDSLLYETDTATGSSGSPICNDDWDLVAIHHWGEPYLAKRENPDSDLPNYVNEGIRISSIYKQLSLKLETLPVEKKGILLEALSFAKLQPSMFKKALSKGPPINSVAVERNESSSKADSATKNDATTLNKILMTNSNNEIKLTIPLEITIKIGNYGLNSIATSTDEAQTKEALQISAEANKIDTDYSNRSGYDANFIMGFEIPLPEVKNATDIAPLKHAQPNAASGVLNYEHFAIVLNKNYRAAFFSATNIDGETYKSVNRTTGVVTPRKGMNQEEGEVWYNDDRIDGKYHLNQAFFSDWSHLFDRGHLTRRTDPSWGTKKVALRADADTFHFSNCSIQHFRFNQTIPYWQGVERYVLENGFLKAGIENRLIVFQGPIYNSEIDLWADDFQIPSKFFKIAIWNSSVKGLQAVGLIVDQSTLLAEQRKALGQPKPVANVNVSQWRVPIADIEEATGLDFSKTVRDADTISQTAQPHVGGEAETKIKIPIRSMEDLLK